MPSFLFEYGSCWNPLAEAFFVKKKYENADSYHILGKTSKVSLFGESPKIMIPQSILLKYSATSAKIKKNEILFREGSEAHFYYQLVSGSIKMIVDSSDGKEFIQGIFQAGDSFGEPPLFCDFPYPSTAVAIEDSEIIKLGKESFFTLLKNNFEIHLQFDQILCKRLRYKAMVLSDISFYDPEHRIMNLLKYLKKESIGEGAKAGMLRSSKPYVVPFTRQQLADMSGLRVETVIRTVKKMEDQGKLKIIGRRISI